MPASAPLGREAIQEVGNTYGRLKVLRRISKVQAEEAGLLNIKWDPNYAHWLCHCKCGGLKIASGPVLRRGFVQSCGCLKRESALAATQDRMEQLKKKTAQAARNEVSHGQD